VRINFTCMQTNIHELPAMVDFTADHGAESLHVRHLVAYGDADSSYREEMAYREFFNAQADQARASAASRGIDLFLPDLIPPARRLRPVSPIAVKFAASALRPTRTVYCRGFRR
jgi:MoaA/NifB/PqqE/SkfB family radical SAM enzyme